MTIADIQCLLVERYDRATSSGTTISRLHQEDAAQVLGLDRHLKYERDAKQAGRNGGLDALFGDFASACQPSVDARHTLFRATVLNWLLGNGDAHVKNFSLLYQSPMRIAGVRLPPQHRLAPIYDVVCIAVYPDYSQDLAMRIGPTEAWHSVDLMSWRRLADLAYGNVLSLRRTGPSTWCKRRLPRSCRRSTPSLEMAWSLVRKPSRSAMSSASGSGI